MALTKAKHDRTLKRSQLVKSLAQLRKWKKNRSKFPSPLDNEVLDRAIEQIEKMLKYFENNSIEWLDVNKSNAL